MIDFLFLDKDTCFLCKEEKIYKNYLCKSCLSRLDYVDNNFKIDGYEAYAIYFYEDFIKDLIGLYKFYRKTAISKVFASIVYEYLEKKNLLDFDYILPSPSSKNTIRNRGFDHISLITDFFIDKTDMVYLDEFKKIKNTKAQHTLSLDERKKNLKGAFNCKKNLENKSVLLFDDIITSGNTVKEIIRTLEDKNVSNIKIVSICSTHKII